MRGPRARRAVDLAQVLRGLDALDLAGQAVREHSHLLADRHGGRRLPVRVCQHRDGRTGLGEAAQAVQERADRGQPHLLGRCLDGQRVRQVVDVLGGAEDVDDLAQGRQIRALAQRLGGGLEVFADQVLDGLDVVAGDGLELAQALDVLGAEVAREGAQVVALGVGQRGRARQDRVVEQENQPLDLDVHARAVQARLGQVVRQGRGHRAVAAVQRAERFTPARQVRIAVGSGEQCHRVAHTPIFPERGAIGTPSPLGGSWRG